MRCSASPTTSTAADTLEATRRGSFDGTLSLAKGDPRAIAAAVLFREVLKPLANGLGPVGEIALGAVADELFARKPR